MRSFALLVLACAAPAWPVDAQPFKAENRVIVMPQATGFTIENGGGDGVRGIRCAAADYARDRLGAPAEARLEVTQAWRKGQAAGFVVRDRAPGDLSVILLATSLRAPGTSLSVGHAAQFCADARIINR